MKKLLMLILMLLLSLIGCGTEESFTVLSNEQMTIHENFTLPKIDNDESVEINLLKTLEQGGFISGEYRAHTIYKYDLSDAVEAVLKNSNIKEGFYDVGLKLNEHSNKNIKRFIDDYKGKRIRTYIDSRVTFDSPIAGNSYPGVIPLYMCLKKDEAEELTAKLNNYLLHRR